ncbi:transcriptional regulator, XRE family with cupin sensor [Anaerovirgula multivorans]|uniref:Transcriptional regulator, XRE family with cupin sensor n=1 Tax=Anaerovirgula multivorans TaxID=312168 RepID=A0A239DB25_9FIRM|nr:cupin domain-containing protein [Anaerovirgula multivorans]SNS29555.1 transcriptional regulator, XRE family with cupin sensor [Anaerovirgula multivorans]
MDIDVGSKIRAIRQEKKMSIAALARQSGISAGMISQIENRKAVPSITVMWTIAKTLGVNIGYFFDETVEDLPNPVVRKDERKKILIGKSKCLYEMLTPDLNRKIEYLLITLEYESQKTRDFLNHEGEECGYVINGVLKVHLGNTVYVLHEGDSISFNSSIPHYFENASEGKCVSIWAMTPPTF